MVMLERIYLVVGVSTHSRAEAAAKAFDARKKADAVSTHSRAEAAAWCGIFGFHIDHQFQHTAARRRLLIY